MSVGHNFVGCRLFISAFILCFLLGLCRQTAALNVIGKNAFQSSTSWTKTANKAVDGITPYRVSCSSTALEVHPWWRMDLSGSLCIGEITIANVGPDVTRLIGAVVRVGESSILTDNSVCGIVTESLAQPREWLMMTCEPPLQGRFISVDIDHEESGSPVGLKICEVFVTESFSTECPNVQVNKTSYPDTTCYASSPLIDPAGDNDFFIGAYMGSRDASADISFGRKSATGHPDNPGLPLGAHQVNHPSGDTSATLFYLPQIGGNTRIGAFYCQADLDDVVTQITTIVLHKNENEVHIRPLTLTKTVNAGESVTLEMRSVNPPTSDLRWRHNGGLFIDRSQGGLTHIISNACVSDAGVYECHVNTYRPLQLHGIMRLIVRACPSGRWGTDYSCSFICPICYNGGICHDKYGQCICAPGFKGNHCEEVLGRDVFAQDGSHYCKGSRDPHGNGCRGKLFCLPDPYGCSCAAGYKGLDCMQECEEGTYGADCKQTCHCATNVTCSKDTGECQGDCAFSYFGVNCQQTACPVGRFGVNCQQSCHCASSTTCHQDSGECDGPCAATYFGPGCQQTDFNGVRELVLHATDNPDELFIMWSRDSSSFYTIAYELTNRGQCEPIDSPTRVLVPDVINGDTTSFTLSGLEPASLYRVYVQSHYGVVSILPTEAFTTASTIQRSDPLRVEGLTVTVTPEGFTVSWQPVQCADEYCLIDDLIKIGECDTAIQPREGVHPLVTNETSVTLHPVEAFSTYRVGVLAMIGDYNGSEATVDVISSSAAPDPPEGLSIASSTADTLLFTWNDLQCVEYRGVFEGYRYNMHDAATNDIVASGTTLVSEVGFAGLAPCHVYSMKVAAISSGVQGPYSEPLVMMTGGKAPGPVSDIKVLDSSSNGFTISWQPPLPNGCEVNEYEIQYVTNTRNICGTDAEEQPGHSSVSSARNSTVLTGLLAGTQYQVYVTATNSAGSGPQLAVIFSTEDSAPTAPPEDVAIFLTSQSIGFSWSEPPCRHRGGLISKYTYRLTYNDSSQQEILTSSQETTNEWTLLGDLLPDTNYCFRIAAWTSAGKGPESTCIRAKTDKVVTPPSINDTRPITGQFVSAVPASFPAAAVVIALVCLVLVIVVVIAVVRFKRNASLMSRGQVLWHAREDGPDTMILSDVNS
ncbi:uncharacterized protein [Asterias amurensis]|uniref:uncharacterized protein isoform X2 n=1 Tax=Asterias amurensis TaxID=7602 RepID=UPI003AB7B92A